MRSKSVVLAAGWVVAALLAGYLLIDRLHEHEPSAAVPGSVPTTIVVEPLVAASPTVSSPSQAEIEAEMARAFPAATPLPPTDAPAAAVPPSTLSTPDPQADLERQFRLQIAQAKAKSDSLEAAVRQECPDLKPGELRLPEAVAQCTRLRADATQAVAFHENLKKEALRAGVWIQ